MRQRLQSEEKKEHIYKIQSLKRKLYGGDTDAERRRKKDNRRYEGSHYGKGPKNYKRADHRIHEDVCDRLTDDDLVDASNIEVTVEAAEVVLTGFVGSREEKRRAEDIAESVTGVSNVENRIRVNQTAQTGIQ